MNGNLYFHSSTHLWNISKRNEISRYTNKNKKKQITQINVIIKELDLLQIVDLIFYGLIIIMEKSYSLSSCQNEVGYCKAPHNLGVSEAI